MLFKKYRPDIERIEKNKYKYVKNYGVDPRIIVTYHFLYVNDVLQKTKVMKIDTWSEKTKYLLNRTHLDEWTGLYWYGKKAINTMFMKMSADIVFTDRFGVVIDVVRNVKPGYISKYYKNGWYVFVFEKGVLSIMSISIGDIVKVWKRDTPKE